MNVPEICNSFKMVLQKIIVCTDCYSPDIIDSDCICTYSNDYEVIELEFDVCECCGNALEIADTKFNENAKPIK